MGHGRMTSKASHFSRFRVYTSASTTSHSRLKWKCTILTVDDGDNTTKTLLFFLLFFERVER